MKVGDINVKRNYQLPQMALDALAVIIFIAIVRCVLDFGKYIENLNSIILKGNGDIKGLVVWQWNLVWIVVASAVSAASLIIIYRPKKKPKGYIVNADNAQKYSDIIITAITCIRIPALLTVFELVCIHQNIMTYQYQRIFSLQIPLAVLLTVIIIRFSVYRIKAIQPKKDKEKAQLSED